jgi:hypothetical protein
MSFDQERADLIRENRELRAEVERLRDAERSSEDLQDGLGELIARHFAMAYDMGAVPGALSRQEVLAQCSESFFSQWAALQQS